MVDMPENQAKLILNGKINKYLLNIFSNENFNVFRVLYESIF